ncbi:Crp/Fnr family transcriptional regulator [Nonomuraea typhae]|uniref:Crp/Fnr family transcriptional regulator n=1 Tax=Nonomuraea typhae TaxID=2603600 RepID=UPI0015E22676|nr:Crp/Fnr family transcriptional regulator [Nonomuraea typhae]
MKIPEALLEGLATLGRAQIFESGEPILHQGDAPERVILLLDGQVRAVREQIDGRPVLLSIVEHKETLGATGVLGGMPRSCTVKAVTRCKCSILSAEQFLALARKSELGDELRRQAMIRINQIDAWHTQIMTLSATGKACYALLRFARRRRDGLYEAKLTHEEIGSAVGLCRQSVDNALHWLRHAGTVTTGQKHIVILKIDRLVSLAESRHRKAKS